ncbi:MAG: serine/threonine protein kinase, partial [Myxococcaceae bacterium]|nr:serine/threonine protein kinase [Myxococcaceae bacterium]
MQPSTFELDPLPYSALLHALARERSSCTVRVTDGIFEGEVHVRDGDVSSASFGNLRGQAALAAIAIAEPLRYALILEPEAELTGRDKLGLASPQVTLLGLGAPPEPRQTPPPLPRFERVPPAPPQHGGRANDLKSWAARAAQQHVEPPDVPLARATKHFDPARKTGSQPAPTSHAMDEPQPVRAQHSLVPAVFARDRTVWIALAIGLPFLLFALFRLSAPRAVAPAGLVTHVAPAAVASSSRVSPPVLVAGTPPSNLTAPAGALAPTVLLRVLVAVDGTVRQVTVQTPRPGLGPLEKQALESARSLRFRPALQDGKAIESWLTLPLPFHTAPGHRVLAIKGSETIGATLGPAWVRGFRRAQPNVEIELDSLGSSTGFAGLLDGSAAVSMSSRPIRAEELAFADRLGVQLRELVVAYDGIAVIVHPDNPLRALDIDTLARVFAQRVTRWSELSGSDAPIHVLGRPSYSGTHAFFRERMLATLGPGGGFGPAVENIEAPKDIVARVAKDPLAIGYVSIGQLEASVRALPLSATTKEPAIAPTHENVRDSGYPISRPLYLYLRADSEHTARAWVDYALSAEGQAEVARQGFVPVQSPLMSSLAGEVPAPHVEPP